MRPLFTSFFTIVGGAAPIAILIYIFSIKEKKRLLAHATEIETALPFMEKLFEKMAELTKSSTGSQTLNELADQFKKLAEAQTMIEEQKKFIKYAKSYDFISAVGYVLRASNYMPNSIGEHKEISKSLPSFSTSDT